MVALASPKLRGLGRPRLTEEERRKRQLNAQLRRKKQGDVSCSSSSSVMAKQHCSRAGEPLPVPLSVTKSSAPAASAWLQVILNDECQNSTANETLNNQSKKQKTGKRPRALAGKEENQSKKDKDNLKRVQLAGKSSAKDDPVAKKRKRDHAKEDPCALLIQSSVQPALAVLKSQRRCAFNTCSEKTESSGHAYCSQRCLGRAVESYLHSFTVSDSRTIGG
jgi:hypothetical protein